MVDVNQMAPDHGRLILRGRGAWVAEASLRLDIALPLEACRAVTHGGLAALWLGPDEWLLLREDWAPDWAATVQARLGDLTGSVVDVSARFVSLIVEGEAADAMLASGCPLDFDRRTFPVDMCTRTIFHKAEIVLWRQSDDRFRIEVARSFAPYVEALIAQVSAEF
jgi:sarcosine oxidase subunit gamma